MDQVEITLMHAISIAAFRSRETKYQFYNRLSFFKWRLYHQIEIKFLDDS